MAIRDRWANFVTPAGGADDGSSEANAWETPTSMEAGVVAGDRVNMQFASRYTLPSSQTFTFAGSITQPIYIKGYESTIGDGGKILLHFPNSFYNWTFNGDYVIADGLDITDVSPNSNNPFHFSSNCGHIDNVTVISSTTGVHSSARVRMDNCSFNNIYIEGVGSNASTEEMVISNRAVGFGLEINCVNGQTGLDIATGYRTNALSNVLIYSQVATTLAGINLTGGINSYGTLLNNFTVDGFDDGIAVDELSATASFGAILNNGIISNASNGLVNNGVNKSGLVISNIAFYNNTTNVSGFGDNEEINTIDLASDPYTDSANQDFSLNNVADGGALLRGTAGIL